jgi:hypothetical protein
MIVKKVLIVVLGFILLQTARAKIVEVFELDPMVINHSSLLR